MIVTVTANPSLDRLVVLGGPLQRGAVHRAAGAAALVAALAAGLGGRATG